MLDGELLEELRRVVEAKARALRRLNPSLARRMRPSRERVLDELILAAQALEHGSEIVVGPATYRPMPDGSVAIEVGGRRYTVRPPPSRRVGGSR